MSEMVTVKKEAIIDLLRLRDEFDRIIESLELMADDEFMESYHLAKQQIKARDFIDWNDL